MPIRLLVVVNSLQVINTSIFDSGGLSEKCPPHGEGRLFLEWSLVERNVVFSHLLRSESGFSVSDPTDEAAGQGWRGGDRKAALAEANVHELHSHLGRHFYDNIPILPALACSIHAT